LYVVIAHPLKMIGEKLTLTGAKTQGFP